MKIMSCFPPSFFFFYLCEKFWNAYYVRRWFWKYIIIYWIRYTFLFIELQKQINIWLLVTIPKILHSTYQLMRSMSRARDGNETVKRHVPKFRWRIVPVEGVPARWLAESLMSLIRSPLHSRADDMRSGRPFSYNATWWHGC